jgi:MYXO-CTERM domain-containing protein
MKLRSYKGGVAAGAIIAATIGFVGTTALADAAEPGFNMAWGGAADGDMANPFNWNDVGTLTNLGGDVWNYAGSMSNETWGFAWDIEFDPDPYITANLVVTNNSNSVQTFSLLMTLPVSVTYENAIGTGSIVGTVTDQTFDDATVWAPDGGSLYTALVDGNAVQTLLDDPFSASAGGAMLSSDVGPGDFGVGNPVDLGVPLNSTIGIFIEFELSPGDAASFSSVFEVIPTPAALPMLLGVGLLGRRRRRN